MQKTLRRWMHSRSVSGHTLQMVIQVHEGRDRYDWQMPMRARRFLWLVIRTRSASSIRRSPPRMTLRLVRLKTPSLPSPTTINDINDVINDLTTAIPNKANEIASKIEDVSKSIPNAVNKVVNQLISEAFPADADEVPQSDNGRSQNCVTRCEQRRSWIPSGERQE